MPTNKNPTMRFQVNAPFHATSPEDFLRGILGVGTEQLAEDILDGKYGDVFFPQDAAQTDTASMAQAV